MPTSFLPLCRSAFAPTLKNEPSPFILSRMQCGRGDFVGLCPSFREKRQPPPGEAQGNQNADPRFTHLAQPLNRWRLIENWVHLRLRKHVAPRHPVVLGTLPPLSSLSKEGE